MDHYDFNRQNQLMEEIAIAAAKLIVEEGLDYAKAKKRAIKNLNLSARTALPDNATIENAVQDYIDLFCADTQPKELYALRELAIIWMQKLIDFSPYLTGAVWHGTATRLSDICLQLFCHDSKLLEITLINFNLDYQVSTKNGFHGKKIDVLSLNIYSDALSEYIGLHLMVYDLDDFRGALKPDEKGRIPRGNLNAVQQLLK